MPRSKQSNDNHRGRSLSASPSPTPSSPNFSWMAWQRDRSISDISMSGDDPSDMPMEYSESEDDRALSPTYATGRSMRTSRETSQASQIVRFASSDSLEEQEPSRKSRSKKLAKKVAKNNSKVWNAVSTLAHSVSRDPQPKRSPTRTKTTQYPHPSSSGTSSAPASSSLNEHSPLLKRESDEKETHLLAPSPVLARPHRQRPLREERAIDIATCFLSDCEHGQRPSLPADLTSISDTLLTLRRWKYSLSWVILTHVACMALFLSCALEHSHQGQAYGLNTFAIIVFGIDMIVGNELRKFQYNASDDPVLVLRHSRIEVWIVPMVVLLFSLTVEMLCNIGVTDTILWSSSLKPIALFYLSTKAKNALEALNRIFRIVLRVLVMELFLILCFATVACQLYSTYDSFHDLSTSWLSLFQLSTTVVNPSIWMPMYSAHRAAAFFFVLFVVTSVFYLHSLVLSVVFQTYVQASADIHDRSMTDREDSMRLAFLALESIPVVDPEELNQHHKRDQVVSMDHVRKTLMQLRPHYNAMKIAALVEIVDPTNQKRIDYPSFRTKIRQALNASIRSTRTASTFSVIVELMASFVAVVNCIYVVLFSSVFDPHWFDAITFPTGCVITVLGAFELLARLGHVKLFHFTPITRLNATFDGLAGLAALISFQGIFNYLTGRPHGIELLLIGRSIDMIRVMRFFSIFREVVRRSGDVFPALTGPLALVLSSVHLFTYLGMALWGGAITIGDYEDEIEPLYDYNNFNSYTEGLVTMFQVLVVNDWHAIALVFLYATRCSHPFIVYPFFVGANLLCVSIMLNCLTAFFVGAFVTKLNDDVDAAAGEVMAASASNGDFTAHSSRAVQRMTSQLSVKGKTNAELLVEAASDAESEEQVEFDVYEREGYDKIMRTVAYGNDDDDEFARQICDVLEVFESLCPGRERVGYMVCCQKTLNRYGNRRFQAYARHYVHENALHMVVSDMHAELLLFSSRDRVLMREFPHLEDPNKKLEITASLIRQQPAMSLFVSRIVKTK